MRKMLRGVRIGLICFMALALTLSGAVAEGQAEVLWTTLNPLMDAVAAAAFFAGEDEPLTVPDKDDTLDAGFVRAFLSFGQWIDPALGITDELLRDTNAQQSYLRGVFSAKPAQLSAINTPEAMNGYIGFHTTKTEQSDKGELLCVGEVYWAEKPMRAMSGADYLSVQWQSPAVFSFQADVTAMKGYRLTGFSIGTSLSLEMTMQNYFEQTLLEYYNSKYSYSVSYPAVFADSVLAETENGISVALPNGDADFFIRREANESRLNLQDLVAKESAQQQNAVTSVNDAFHYGLVAYRTNEGRLVFTIYAVTDESIYHAQLSFREELAQTYCAYAFYMENSFSVGALGGIG